MSEQDDKRQQKYRTFIELMPLTLALAGLPQSEHGKYYTSDQIEARGMTIKNAFREAKRCVKEQLES